MGSRLAAWMAGIMPLMVPTITRIVVAMTTMVHGDEQVDVGGVGVLGERAVEGDAADGRG